MILKANTTKVTLNGKEYNLSLNFGVIRRVQADNKGMTMEDIFHGLEKQDFNVISTLLYNGIKWNHKDFEIKEIDELGLGEIASVLEAIVEVVNKSMPAADKEDEVEAEKK